MMGVRAVVAAALSAILIAGPGVSSAFGGTDSAQSARLQSRVREAFAKEDWKAAIEAGLALHAIDVRGGSTAFNLAVAYAQSGDGAAAAEWLVTAGKDGFAGATIASTAPELAPARGEAKYEEAMALIRANRATHFEAFKAEAEAHEPLVVLPSRHDASKPAPLIVALHGTGGDGKSMAAVWRATAARAGAILVCPDALRPAGGGYQWTFVDESEWLVLRTVERVRAKHSIDAERMVLTGFSQGANVSLQVSTAHPGVFRGVIVCCGHYEPHAQRLPEHGAALPRYALLTGEHDEGAASNRVFSREITERGGAALLRVYEGAGHSLPADRDGEFRRALEFVMTDPG